MSLNLIKLKDVLSYGALSFRKTQIIYCYVHLDYTCKSTISSDHIAFTCSELEIALVALDKIQVDNFFAYYTSWIMCVIC